jgi:hypothetical protein
MKQTYANKGIGMSRDSASPARCFVVWSLATAALVATWWLAGATAWSLVRPATWRGSFEDLLVAVCASALLGCGLRLWAVTTATTAALLRGRLPSGTPGIARRLVLVACGAAVVAGVSAPAMAAHGGDHGRLAGLPLPDRATAGVVVHHGPASRPHPAPQPAARPAATRDEVVVRPGDSLWALAAAGLPDSAGPEDVERAWREVYEANRAEIGPDPGVILPGQRLRLPALDEGSDR